MTAMPEKGGAGFAKWGAISVNKIEMVVDKK